MAGFDFTKVDNFYVYTHSCPTTGEVRYVGKGRNKRAYKLTDRTSKHKNWIISLGKKSLKPKINIVKEGLTECLALELEEFFILKYRELGNDLNNVYSCGGGYTPKQDNTAWNKGMFGEESTHYGKKQTFNTKLNQAIAQHNKIVLSGKGVAYFNNQINKWHSRISFMGKRTHIGFFDTKEEATKKYLEYLQIRDKQIKQLQ